MKLVSVEKLVKQVSQDNEENQVNLDHQASLDNQVHAEKTENKDLKVWMTIQDKICLNLLQAIAETFQIWYGTIRLSGEASKRVK